LFILGEYSANAIKFYADKLGYGPSFVLDEIKFHTAKGPASLIFEENLTTLSSEDVNRRQLPPHLKKKYSAILERAVRAMDNTGMTRQAYRDMSEVQEDMLKEWLVRSN
jgi:hypothetical protein